MKHIRGVILATDRGGYNCQSFLREEIIQVLSGENRGLAVPDRQTSNAQIFLDFSKKITTKFNFATCVVTNCFKSMRYKDTMNQ